MWVKSEADRRLYNLELAHTVDVIKKGTKYYVVALYAGVSVNAPAHLGDVHVAQLTVGRGEEEAHQMMSRVTRSMGEDVLNLDTAESRKKAPGSSTSASPAPAVGMNPHVARSIQESADRVGEEAAANANRTGNR